MLIGNALRDTGKSALSIFAAVSMFASLSAPAQGSLIGDEITIEFSSIFFSLSENVIVGAGPEIVGASPGVGSIAEVLGSGGSIDIAGETIAIEFVSGIDLSISFSDLQWQDVVGEIVALPSISGHSGLGSSAFTSDSVTFGDISMAGAGTIIIDFSDAVTHESETTTGTAVSEPGTIALLGLGVLGLGLAGLRRRFVLSTV